MNDYLDRFQWIQHKGKSILYIDYSNLNISEYNTATEAAQEFIIANGKDDLLILTNMSNNHVTKKTLEKSKKTARIVQTYIKKNAVIGMTEIQGAFLDFISLFSEINIKSFSSMEQAKDWLIQ
jgi:hypothetical protein